MIWTGFVVVLCLRNSAAAAFSSEQGFDTQEEYSSCQTNLL